LNIDAAAAAAAAAAAEEEEEEEEEEAGISYICIRKCVRNAVILFTKLSVVVPVLRPGFY
jgi:hypothetical protein